MFEFYLMQRLESGPQGHWLDGMPLHVAMQACLSMGILDRHGPLAQADALTESQLRGCYEAGFETATDRVQGIERLIARVRLSNKSGRSDRGPPTILGNLYKWLSYNSRDPALEPFREAVREGCISAFPMRPGEKLLGRSVEKPRLVSLRTASREHGISIQRLLKLMKAAGLVSASDEGADPSSIPLEASSVAPLLTDLRDALSQIQAASYLGISKKQMNDLAEARLVTPFMRAATGVSRNHMFRRRDLDAFIASLSSRRRSRLCDEASLVDIATAAKAVKRPHFEVAKLLADGKLSRVGLTSNRSRYESVLVDPDEVRHAFPIKGYCKDLTQVGVARALRVPPEAVSKLCKMGIIETQPSASRRARRTVIKDGEVARFKAEYVSLIALSKAIGVHFSKARMQLAGMGVHPVITKAQVSIYLYSKKEVRALEPLRILLDKFGERG